jgi:transcriptional regulator with XRE-family HTH domain
MNRQEIKRRLATLSYGELGRRAGVSKPHISLIFRGLKNASEETVAKLATVLGCPAADLAAFIRKPVERRPYGRRFKRDDVGIAA